NSSASRRRYALGRFFRRTKPKIAKPIPIVNRVRGSGTEAPEYASKSVNTIFGLPVVKWMYRGADTGVLLVRPKNRTSDGELLKTLFAQPPVVTSMHQLPEPATVVK